MISLKNMIRILLGLTLLLALAIFSLRYYVSEKMMKPKRFLVEEHFEQFKRGTLPSDNGIENHQYIDLYTDDSTRLSAYYIPAKGNTNKTIIGLHDFASCKEHLYTMARWAQDKGINTFIFDIRAHGKSEGAYFSYGKKESKDLIKVIDWLRQTKPDDKIGLWGFSSGANIAIQTMAVDERISFAILENTFLRSQDLAVNRQENVPNLISKLAFQRVKGLLEINDKNDPIELANRIKQNILMIHGEKNQLFSNKEALLLFEEFDAVNKHYYNIKGAHHFNLWHYGGKELATKFELFIDEQ